MICHHNPQSITDKCIVLDLDETCLHTVEGFDKLIQSGIMTKSEFYPIRNRLYKFNIVDVVTPSGTGEITQVWGVKRPGLDEFINFCCGYFRGVMVWSAGKYKYVHAITEKVIFKNSKCCPKTIFTFNDCEISNRHYVKRLSNMFSHESVKGFMTPSNTFVLDDRQYTFSLNTGNGILIPEYYPKLSGKIDTIDPIKVLNDKDDALQKLQIWLMNPLIREAADVRSIDKSRIFV
jgi:hypothetical protein